MDKAAANHKKMTETPVGKLILMLGIPTTISMLITNIYNLADTYFVGTISIEAQAATSVLFTLQCIIQAVSFMFGQGAGTHVAKSLADNDTKKASEYTATAFYLGIVLGIILLTFGLIFLGPFVEMLGSSKNALADSKEYGMWILLSAPFLIGSIVLNNVLRFEGKAMFSMIGLVTGGLLNIFGDYVFIMIMGMGTRGAGLSTAISQVISFAILLILFIKYCQSKLHPKYIARELKTYFQICRAGFPSLIRQGLTAISNGILNNLCKPYDDAAVAAMGIVNRYSNFILCVGIGIGQGFQPVAAYNYRIKKYNRVKKGLIFTTVCSTIAVAVLAVFGLIIPDKLVYLFNSNEAVINAGTKAMRYMSIGIIFVPICVSTNMLYQSTRQAEIASFLALLRSGLVFIPLILILEPAIGFLAIEISMPISHIAAGIISLPFLLYFIYKTPNDGSESNEIIENR
ncbi:MAG: MATE family efflux transporter [Acholeplasmatales bacterium]|nr:MATE family efflux transporter [Acholeplasmatales bacterium]